MTQCVLRNTVAVLATLLVLAPATAGADHRPNNEVLVGGAISQTGRFAEPAGRQVNSIKMWVDEIARPVTVRDGRTRSEQRHENGTARGSQA